MLLVRCRFLLQSVRVCHRGINERYRLNSRSVYQLYTNFEVYSFTRSSVTWVEVAQLRYCFI